MTSPASAVVEIPITLELDEEGDEPGPHSRPTTPMVWPTAAAANGDDEDPPTLVRRIERPIARAVPPLPAPKRGRPLPPPPTRTPRREAIDGTPRREAIDGTPRREAIDGTPRREAIQGTPRREAMLVTMRMPRLSFLPFVFGFLAGVGLGFGSGIFATQLRGFDVVRIELAAPEPSPAPKLVGPRDVEPTRANVEAVAPAPVVVLGAASSDPPSAKRPRPPGASRPKRAPPPGPGEVAASHGVTNAGF
jgi:hypothetical protein